MRLKKCTQQNYTEKGETRPMRVKFMLQTAVDGILKQTRRLTQLWDYRNIHTNKERLNEEERRSLKLLQENAKKRNNGRIEEKHFFLKCQT